MDASASGANLYPSCTSYSVDYNVFSDQNVHLARSSTQRRPEETFSLRGLLRHVRNSDVQEIDRSRESQSFPSISSVSASQSAC